MATKNATKAKKEGAVYTVLVGIQNDETGLRFEPGATISTTDFSESVISNWLKCEPPVLKKEEADSGSDSER